MSFEAHSSPTRFPGNAKAPYRRPSYSPDESLRLASYTLITALLREHAEPIVGSCADPEDVTERAEHIGRVLAAVTDYVNVIIADTAEYVPAGGVEKNHLAGLMKDTAADIVGSIRASADECVRF